MSYGGTGGDLMMMGIWHRCAGCRCWLCRGGEGIGMGGWGVSHCGGEVVYVLYLSRLGGEVRGIEGV